jgi:hypothetical protein
VICFINNDIGYAHDIAFDDDFQSKLLTRYSESSVTRFKFVNLINVNISKLNRLNYSLVSLDHCSYVSINGCDAINERQAYRFDNVKNVKISDCSDEVIRNCDFAQFPTNNLSINFKDTNKIVDQDSSTINGMENYSLGLSIGCSEILNLSNVDVLGDVSIRNIKGLDLSFAKSGEAYIDTLSAPSLERLSLSINGARLPEFGSLEMPENINELSLQDNYTGENTEGVVANGFFSGFLSNLTNKVNRLTLGLATARLLHHIQSFNFQNVTEFKLIVKEPISPELAATLMVNNLQKLSVVISGSCDEIPVFPLCQDLEILEIINELPQQNNLKISQDMKLNDIYPNLQELIIHNVNNDVLISNWFKDSKCTMLKSLRLLNVENISNLITFNDCEFPDLELIEINGIVNSNAFHELEISLKNSPRLKTIVVKIDELNEDFSQELSIWEDYFNELNLKVSNQQNLRNLIIKNINSVYLRNINNLEKIVHGGDLDLQFLDADFLPNLQELIYKNLNIRKPIQSVNYINPACCKKILKNSLHPLPESFSV